MDLNVSGLNFKFCLWRARKVHTRNVVIKEVNILITLFHFHSRTTKTLHLGQPGIALFEILLYDTDLHCQLHFDK